MSCRIAVFALVCAISSASTVRVVGQARPPETVTTREGVIPIPVASAPLGQKDAAAVDEVTKHLTVVGQTLWTGMQARGKLLHGLNEGDGVDAVLSNRGGTEFRLDVQTSSGETSTRLQNANGKLQESDGKVSTIPSNTAALGLFPFEKLRAPNALGASTSLLDRGMVTLGGANLHRITYEFAGTGIDPATNAGKILAIDFYFDPATHLLVKSAASGQFPDSGHAHFLFVVTYADYRRVGESMIPYSYSETVDGEPYRTLQFSDVQLNPSFDATYFQF